MSYEKGSPGLAAVAFVALGSEISLLVSHFLGSQPPWWTHAIAAGVFLLTIVIAGDPNK